MPSGAHTQQRKSSPSSAAQQLRRRVRAAGERHWSQEDFPDLPPQSVAQELSRLARRGELTRVRKGVYYRPKTTVLGPSTSSPSQAAAKSLVMPVHPAGLSAAATLGLTTQNPGRPEFATPASKPPAALRGSVVHVRRPRARTKLSAEDGALLEVLRDRASTSDLGAEQTAEQLTRLVADPARFARIVKGAQEEPPRVRAMLGALGERAHADERLLRTLHASLNPLSKYKFGLLAELPNARAWQGR